ncbi:MAG: HEAT repeat domain-containing protein, partial [Candidatus Hydrogenedentes bacterium]|nr:HEAT repeat domain-containing protein [Candidatus Hydrogenedentota bacterium]
MLTALLVDEELSHMARYALEPMPYPEAGQALRDALGTTSGRLKVGVINSLAIRKDEQAVPELTKLLSDSDAMIMQAAAVSLGQIANAEAQKALEDAIAQANSPRGNLNALCDGLLGCAEKLALKQQPKEAIRLYDLVLQAPNATPQVRSAAMRGAVLNRNTEEALPLLMAQLGGKDADDFSGALRVARELSGNQDVTAALAGFLPAAPLERKILILGVFGEDDGDAAGAAVLAEAADGDAGVRAAALRALTRMHYSPA